MIRIVDPAVPLTALQQRLRYMANAPERTWTNIVENVPRWPEVPPRTPPPDGAIEDYAPCEGVHGLLELIAAREAAHHRLALVPAQLLVTNGGMHAISLIARLLAGAPGGVALVQAPVFTSVAEILRAAGLRVEFFSVDHGGPDLERLAAALTPQVRLVYLNTPNNPVGETVSRPAMASLVALTESRRVPLVADMVYDSFVFDGAEATSPLGVCDRPRHVFVLNSMSKNYGMPGLRVGWITAPAERIQQLAALHERECVAVSGPSQHAAAQLLRHGNDALVAHVRDGRRFLLDAIRGVEGVRFQPPAGATQMLVELPVADIEGFADVALAQLGLALATTSQYAGLTGSYIRLPLGAPRPLMVRALQLLREALRRGGEAEATAPKSSQGSVTC